jgi:hypothetical protein
MGEGCTCIRNMQQQFCARRNPGYECSGSSSALPRVEGGVCQITGADSQGRTSRWVIAWSFEVDPALATVPLPRTAAAAALPFPPVMAQQGSSADPLVPGGLGPGRAPLGDQDQGQGGQGAPLALQRGAASKRGGPAVPQPPPKKNITFPVRVSKVASCLTACQFACLSVCLSVCLLVCLCVPWQMTLDIRHALLRHLFEFDFRAPAQRTP